MNRDKYKTDVMFRIDKSKDFKGTIFAILPHNAFDPKGYITIYQHVGQHSARDYNHCLKTSKPAKKSEYKDLKKEMESFGYNFNVVRRQNRFKYLKDYYENR